MTTISNVESRAIEVGRDVAAKYADAVDREGRFPAETVDAMRETSLLSAMVPVELGGEGATIPEIACAVRALASHCASSALVFAMHQIEIAYLARHGTTDALTQVLRDVVSDQLLIANANSEVGIGGDAGQSICAIERADGRFHLEKQTIAISYGEYADAIISTARAHPDSAPTDQVLVLCRAENLNLEPTTRWNTTGLRGTQSGGYRLIADEPEDLVFPEPFSTIATRTGSPVTQILLGSVWWGLAEAAAAKAHTFVRAQARKNLGSTQLPSLRFAELTATLQPLRDLISSAARRYEDIKDDEAVEDWRFAALLRNLKVTSSSTALKIATRALGICGLAGYSLESPYCMDRIIRDVHGGPIMVSNDRLLDLNAHVLLVMEDF